MAYREFHNEEYYAAPDVGIVERGLANMNETIADLMRAASEEKKKKALAADQYKFDLGKGSFETDDQIFFQRGQNITARTRNDLKQYGSISQQVQGDQNQALMDKSASDWQYKAMTDMTAEVARKEKDDPYFDSTDAYKSIKTAAYGENNDVYYTTRGERLDAVSKTLFTNPKSLKGKMYTSAYVKDFGKKETTKAGANPNEKSSNYSATPFITPSGVPGVTVDHAKQYLNSRPDGSVGRWVESLVDDKMIDEVKLTREKNSNLKGMSDQDALLYLKAHPEENVANKTMYSDRVIAEAQREMLEAADLNFKTDYETKVDKSITNGLYTNDYIGHSYTTFDEEIGTDAIKSNDPNVSNSVARTFGGTRNNLPGGNLRVAKGPKVGQAIPMDVSSPYMINTRNGKLIANRGSTQLNLTGYQLAGYGTDGKPRILSRAQIKNMRPEEFKNLQPELGVALKGHIINQGNKLGELSSRQSELDDRLAEAVRSNDVEAQESVQEQLDNLDELRQKLNLSPDEISEEDLMSAYKQNGINVSSIQMDVILKPSDADISVINKTITRGLDISNPAQYNDEMLGAKAEYRAAYQRAAATGFSSQKIKHEEFTPLQVQPVKKGTTKPVAPGPKAGTIESGYRFKGGDPKDAKNWEEVK